MATRHIGSPEEQLALDVFIKLNRSMANIDRKVHGPLREFNLTATQFGVLDVLNFSGAQPISVIAEKNLCSQNSLCSVIDTMERHGLVERVRSKTDRRVVHIQATVNGVLLFDQIWDAHLKRIVASMSHLETAELEQLNSLLRKLGKAESA